MEKNIKKIIVFAPNKKFFGHIILQLPFYSLLKELYPKAIIIIYSPVKEIALVKKFKLCHNVVHYRKGIKEFSLLPKLFSEKADLIINIRPYSLLIQLLILLTPRAYKLGYHSAAGSKLVYHKSIKYDTKIYKADLYVNLIKQLKKIEQPYSFIQNLKNDSSLNFDNMNKYICVFPGGGEGEHKKWGIDHFISLSKNILKIFDFLKIVFILGPSEESYKEIINKELPENSYYILSSPSLNDIANVSQFSLVNIANDCGPAHIAQMCDNNYIGIWGWEKQHPVCRILEWTRISNFSLHIIAERNMSIKTISPERVLNIVRGIVLGKIG